MSINEEELMKRFEEGPGGTDSIAVYPSQNPEKATEFKRALNLFEAFRWMQRPHSYQRSLASEWLIDCFGTDKEKEIKQIIEADKQNQRTIEEKQQRKAGIIDGVIYTSIAALVIWVLSQAWHLIVHKLSL